MRELIFAYGSNMCSARLRDYKVLPESAGQPASLGDFRLRFNKKSNDGSGKANIESHPGASVWGVVYPIPDSHLAILDGEEAGYRRVTVQVRVADGEQSVWTYLANESRIDQTLKPYTWYTNFLISGAIEHGLPETYISDLRSVEADLDHSEERNRAKLALATRSAGRVSHNY